MVKFITGVKEGDFSIVKIDFGVYGTLKEIEISTFLTPDEIKAAIKRQEEYKRTIQTRMSEHVEERKLRRMKRRLKDFYYLNHTISIEKGFNYETCISEEFISLLFEMNKISRATYFRYRKLFLDEKEVLEALED